MKRKTNTYDNIFPNIRLFIYPVLLIFLSCIQVKFLKPHESPPSDFTSEIKQLQASLKDSAANKEDIALRIFLLSVNSRNPNPDY
ncbi:MAG: hypothetical protein ABIA63_14935, partial [bacterium]